jgi:hypothetical protein
MNSLPTQEMINLHAAKEFAWKTLSTKTRRAFERGGVKLSASGNVNGMTLNQVDKVLGELNPPLTSADRMEVKLDLSRSGILLAP